MACIFGELTKIDTTGASEKTAKKDNLKTKGVEASHNMAETDLKRVDKYKSIIIKVGTAKQMEPAVIAGIISRETRGGLYLTKDGFQIGGKGFGLMQVDTGYHEARGEWDSEEHVTQATDILISFIKIIQKNFPTWTKEQQFKGGISAYNGGPGNVRTYEGMDIGTSGDDYANDVVARAQWFKENGY